MTLLSFSYCPAQSSRIVNSSFTARKNLPDSVSGLKLLPWALFFVGISFNVNAGVVVGHILDSEGHPVSEGVIFAIPIDKRAPEVKSNTKEVIAQERSVFVPYVTVVQKGTSVSFTNRDSHDHNLRSFSPAKTFELLISGKNTASPPSITFDNSGEVAMVCYFHSWMRGFVYVVDTPYFTKTDKSGNAVLNNLPEGTYEIKAWAPNMISAPPTKTVSIKTTGSSEVKYQLDYVPKPAPQPKAKAKDNKDKNYP